MTDKQLVTLGAMVAEMMADIAEAGAGLPDWAKVDSASVTFTWKDDGKQYTLTLKEGDGEEEED